MCDYSGDTCNCVGFGAILTLATTSLETVTEQMRRPMRRRSFEEAPDYEINSLLILAQKRKGMQDAILKLRMT